MTRPSPTLTTSVVTSRTIDVFVDLTPLKTSLPTDLSPSDSVRLTMTIGDGRSRTITLTNRQVADFIDQQAKGW